MKNLIAALALTLFATSSFAADKCSVEEGKFSYDKAVKVGTRLLIIKPHLNIMSQKAPISVNIYDGKVEESAGAFCRALGLSHGYVNATERFNQPDQMITVLNLRGELRGMVTLQEGEFEEIISSVICQ